MHIIRERHRLRSRRLRRRGATSRGADSWRPGHRLRGTAFRRGFAAAVGLCLLLGMPLAGPSVAAATMTGGDLTDVPETGREGYLVLRADPYPADFSGLTPGDEVAWTIQARLEDAPSGRLQLRLAGSGSLVHHARGLEVSVRSCTEPFTSRTPQARCTGTETEVLPTSRLADVSGPAPGGGTGSPGGPGGPGGLGGPDGSDTAGSVSSPEPPDAAAGRSWRLADVVAGSPRYLMVTLGLPEEGSWDRSLQGLTGRVGVGLYAGGDQSTPPDPSDPSDPSEPPQPPGSPEPAEPTRPADPTGSPEPTESPDPTWSPEPAEPREPSAEPSPPASDPDDPDLPVTGTQAPWLLAVAALLMVAGVAMLRARRGRRSP